MMDFLNRLRRFRRGEWELVASALIGTGVLMSMQPLALSLYSWSFAVTLTGTVLFIASTKFPE